MQTPSPIPPQPPPPLLTPRDRVVLVAELARLRRIHDHDLPALLRDAKGFVASDAAEEIVQIHEDRAIVARRIARLEDLLRTAQVVVDDAGATVVAPGYEVEIEYLRTGKVAAYRITGLPLASGAGTVSTASPIGSALLGRSPGDVVAVELPGGRVEDLRVLSVTPEELAA